ncbi:hypothetical protein RQP46_011076 [Phenoliferia psychrophenolica]
MTTVLIIGGNRGVGLGLVIESLKRSSDVTVFATAREPAKATALAELQQTFPGRLHILKADMTDEASLVAAAAELKDVTHSLNTLIINAGVALGVGHVKDLSASDFLENLNVNVVGPHSVTKVFSPFLLESKAAKRTLAYISSGVGSFAALPEIKAFMKQDIGVDFVPYSGYCVSKLGFPFQYTYPICPIVRTDSRRSGLNMLGRQWADVLEPQGIATLLISPGYVATDLNDHRGHLTIEESASGVLNVIATAQVETGSKGLLSYNGDVFGW